MKTHVNFAPRPRTSKLWWVVTDSTVVQAEGLDCHDPAGNSQKGAWWFPSLGFTAFEGGSVFTTKAEAKTVLVKKLEGQIPTLQTALEEAKAL